MMTEEHGSRFRTFVLLDDEQVEDSAWLESLKFMRLALRDHQYEGDEINDMDRQMADMLALTGYHEIKWLRKNVREILTVDMSELAARVDHLRKCGDDELVELVLDLRRGSLPKPKPALLPANAQAKKLAALKSMAELGKGNEAENAKREMEKREQLLATLPRAKSILDLDWDDMKVETVATPTQLLIKALDERLDWQEPMARIRYRFRDEARNMHDAHSKKLIGMLSDPHGLSKRRLPKVERRRQS